MTEIGSVLHPCEDTVLCQITLKQKLPFPSAIIYLGENQKVGRVDEVLGPLDDVYLSIKLDNGILPSSIKPGQKIFTTGDKIMLASRVTEPKKSGGPRGASKPRGGPAQFGNRGGDRGGRGGARGGFGGRGGRGGSSGGRR
jgi:H/ACA ribonucleoprotein complex subunit 1